MVYETDAVSIKNVLFKDFEAVISEAFDADGSEISLEEVLSLSDNNKPKKQAKTNDNPSKQNKKARLCVR